MKHDGYLSNSEYVIASDNRTTSEARKLGILEISSYSVLRSCIVKFVSNMIFTKAACYFKSSLYLTQNTVSRSTGHILDAV